jgi:putative transposase
MRANQDTYPVGVMCRLLRVSKSGFYAWMKRPMSAHTCTDGKRPAATH